MRISGIVFVLIVLATVAAVGYAWNSNASACDPLCASSASHKIHGAGGGLDKADKAIACTCPMHPEVSADKPGMCPKCWMNLEKKTEKVVYEHACPMHAGVISDKPGTCPKCGMFLEARPKSSGVIAVKPHAGHAH